VDETIITKLYEASCAGVKIDLIVRGICCLRPRVPALSENIRVISVVGRFLEHSRIFHFGNAGHPEVYLSSADWMPRNFFRRVELTFPIKDPGLCREIVEEILPTFLRDRVKARELQPDGSYRRLAPREGKEKSQAQLTFRNRAREEARRVAEAQTAPAVKLVPLVHERKKPRL
jgi:polyphosphate kinase